MIDSTQLHVGDRPQLFTDGLLIESVSQITRRWHKPQRLRDTPVIHGDAPWERTLYFTYSNYQVLRDPADGLLKCWYEDLGRMGQRAGGHPLNTRVGYAQSRDGIHWEKPQLDVIKIDGQWTNCVMGHAEGSEPTRWNPWADVGVHSNAFVIDPDPPSPEFRFRTIFTRLAEGEGPAGHFSATEIAHSADGIHWHRQDATPRIGSSGGKLGDVSVLFRDEDAKLFVQNTRHRWMGVVAGSAHLPKAAGWAFTVYPHRFDLQNRRRIYQTRSADFLHWTEPVLISAPSDDIDNLDEAHYGMGQFKVGSIHFGLLGVFQSVDNGMHVRLVQSRDGVNFSPTDNAQPFFAPRGQGHWDARMISMTSPPIEMDGKWLFYHGGCACHHDWWMDAKADWDHPEVTNPQSQVKFGLGVTSLRKEGFASLDTPEYRHGWVITRPMRTEGTKLRINARCRQGGSIRIEVRSRAEQVVGNCSIDNSDAFTGDSTDHLVTWQGDAHIAGNDDWRKLVIVMEKAELFSIRFE